MCPIWYPPITIDSWHILWREHCHRLSYEFLSGSAVAVGASSLFICLSTCTVTVWGFPETGDLQRKVMENPIEMDDLGIQTHTRPWITPRPTSCCKPETQEKKQSSNFQWIVTKSPLGLHSMHSLQIYGNPKICPKPTMLSSICCQNNVKPVFFFQNDYCLSNPQTGF